MPSREEVVWIGTLDEMERHLVLVDEALRGERAYPGTFTTPIPNVALPTTLQRRAQLLLDRQRDAESILRVRTEALGRLIFGPSTDADPTGVSIDVRS